MVLDQTAPCQSLFDCFLQYDEKLIYVSSDFHKVFSILEILLATGQCLNI